MNYVYILKYNVNFSVNVRYILIKFCMSYIN